MNLFPRTARLRHPRRGAALIVVLSIVFLLTALVIAFMLSARNDLVQVIYYEAGREAHALADTASNIVMAQIREATLSGIDSLGRGTHAWASQPGAIRVWNDSGTPVQLYKLYSASRMKETNMDFLAGEIPGNWRTRPDEYVDINEPVATGSDADKVWRYPILNPEALEIVEGFSSPLPNDPSVEWDSRTSMPVRWLYVGSDGVLADSRQENSVGRIAFWTDDETCKVNINTASASASNPAIVAFPPGSTTSGSETALGYSYWDLPYTQLRQDWNMARSAPSQAEYQRYPGHPASVNLLTVLAGAAFESFSNAEKTAILKQTFNLFPAYRWGGSENGRIPWTLMATRTPLSGANQKSERLYASVDELRFSPNMAGALRDENALPPVGQSDEVRLDYWKFFLTSHSRAPDINLFGQPRLAIWPISHFTGELHRTTQDNLIAFCSTYGPANSAARKEYFFTRKNPLSQTEDWDTIPRNRALFTYLQDLTARNIPGFGGNFREKYDAPANDGIPGERDQILTAIFDYVRCVNLNETFEFKPDDFQSYTAPINVPPELQGSTSGYNTWNFNNYLSYKGAGMVLPIVIDHGTYTTRGAGRVPVLSEAALFAMQQGISDTEGSGELQTALFFETFSPMQGYMPWTPNDFQLRASTDMTVEGEPPFPNAGSGVTTAPYNRGIAAVSGHATSQPAGGTDGFAWTMGMAIHPWGGSSTAFPVFSRNRSNPIPILPPPVDDEHKLQIGAGNLSVDFIMAGSNFQSYELRFPQAEISIPEPSSPTPESRASRDWELRMTDNKGVEIKPHDVAHSLVPKDGDYRIMAYLQEVPWQFFRPHPGYGGSENFAHTLRQRKNFGLMGSSIDDGTTNGSFVNLPYGKVDISGGGFWTGSPSGYFWTDHPDVPPDITDLIAAGWTGDWANGVADFPDGAYLGKADDGYRSIVSTALYLGGEFSWHSGAGFFSPTQQMPSAVMFGSLPTGVKRTEQAYLSGNDADAQPWRSLLFCPNPAAGGSHFGFVAPRDSLLLDLFTMPVVEPYAISEPTSTAGRINLNYQILPFTHIERSTALHAVFSSQRITALPDSISEIRSGHPLLATQGAIQSNPTRMRHWIDPEQTLRQFTTRFDSGDIFRSASEICSIWLVPEGRTLENTPDWWTTHRATGNNLREHPYATLYPLLTTKSNTFTVHVLAQSLAQGTENVTGEYRGSNTIERYIDPMDDRLVNAAHDPDTKSVEPLYRFRVVETKRFAP